MIGTSEYADRSVCVIGLGYVGLTLAVSMADVGFEVHGVEVRDSVLVELTHGRAHFHEPRLEEKLQEVINAGNFHFSQEIPTDWIGSVYIITVGTPLDQAGCSRMDMIQNASQQVAGHLKEGDLVIMRSTVKLGVTRKLVVPTLNSAGCNYDLAFCPERTLEGKALTELRALPQIVGGHTYVAGIRASQLFQFLTPTVVRVSDVETAEMIKLIDNAQRDVAFAYANEVARACDAVGISAAEVIRAGKLGYARTNLPMPGPVGGPCLEKDSHILAEGLRERGVEPTITMAARSINEGQPFEVIKFIHGLTQSLTGFPRSPTISLLGIAFKGRPATDDLRGTMAKPTLAALYEFFPTAKFRGFDPVVKESEIKNFGLQPVSTLEAAFKGAHLILILNNHSLFFSMPVAQLADQLARPGLIYDFWNCHDAVELHLPRGTGYMALGSHGKAKLPEGS